MFLLLDGPAMRSAVADRRSRYVLGRLRFSAAAAPTAARRPRGFAARPCDGFPNRLWTFRSKPGQRIRAGGFDATRRGDTSLRRSSLPRCVEELGEERQEVTLGREEDGRPGGEVLHPAGESAPAITRRAEVHDERAVWRQRRCGVVAWAIDFHARREVTRLPARVLRKLRSF